MQSAPVQADGGLGHVQSAPVQAGGAGPTQSAPVQHSGASHGNGLSHDVFASDVHAPTDTGVDGLAHTGVRNIEVIHRSDAGIGQPSGSGTGHFGSQEGQGHFGDQSSASGQGHFAAQSGQSESAGQSQAHLTQADSSSHSSLDQPQHLQEHLQDQSSGHEQSATHEQAAHHDAASHEADTGGSTHHDVSHDVGGHHAG